MKGEYKINGSWKIVDYAYLAYNTLWSNFLLRKKCIKCEKTWSTSFCKPFCISCLKQIKKDNEFDNRVQIKDSQKFLLRKNFEWLSNVPGDWVLGKTCYFCDENYNDQTINEKYQQFWESNTNFVSGYVWYFGDKKCCCTVCLDKQCRDRGIL